MKLSLLLLTLINYNISANDSCEILNYRTQKVASTLRNNVDFFKENFTSILDHTITCDSLEKFISFAEKTKKLNQTYQEMISLSEQCNTSIQYDDIINEILSDINYANFYRIVFCVDKDAL